MWRKKLVVGVLVSLFIFIAPVVAQKNEVSGLIGRTFISDQVITGSTSFDNKLRFGNGLSFEGNYARRLLTGKFLSLTFEVPVMVNPDEDLHAALPSRIPEQYRSVFVTPAARVHVFTDQGVSPWVSVGGGFGHFSESTNLLFGGRNPGKTGTTTGAFQVGVGLDVKLFREFRLRGEGRYVWSGLPQLDVHTDNSRQLNIFVGGGLVWRF
jgi:opacity protein-like surface antigen